MRMKIKKLMCAVCGVVSVFAFSGNAYSAKCNHRAIKDEPFFSEFSKCFKNGPDSWKRYNEVIKDGTCTDSSPSITDDCYQKDSGVRVEQKEVHWTKNQFCTGDGSDRNRTLKSYKDTKRQTCEEIERENSGD